MIKEQTIDADPPGGQGGAGRDEPTAPPILGHLPDIPAFTEREFRIGTFVWNIEPEVIYWSDGMFELFGLAPGSVEPTFNLIQTLTHEEDRRSPASLHHAINQGLSLNREFRVVLPSGCIRWLAVRAQPIVGRHGKTEKVVGGCIDVTEKHTALAEAQFAERRRQALVQAFGGVAWLARADGAIMDMANWGEKRAPGVIPWGEGWLQWVHSDDRERVHAQWKNAVREKSPYINDYRVMTADGTYRWIQARAVPLKDNNGDVLEWVGMTFDGHDPAEDRGIKQTDILTGAQIRGARGILNWSVRDLAEAAQVSPAVLRRLEEFDGPASCPEDVRMSIAAALSRGGVEFVRLACGKPAIRPR